MGTLLDAARVIAANRPRGNPCSISVLRERHPEQANDIDHLIENAGPNKEVTYQVAAETLRKNFPEATFKYDVVSRHARHLCSCRY